MPTGITAARRSRASSSAAAFAEGRGTDVELGTFRFTAQGIGGAYSFSAIGTMKYRRHLFGNQSITADVFCMTVDPLTKTAVITGRITHSDLVEGLDWLKFIVQDVEDPGDERDRFVWLVLDPDEETEPPCTIPGFQGSPIVKGDIEVVASTFPF